MEASTVNPGPCNFFLTFIIHMYPFPTMICQKAFVERNSTMLQAEDARELWKIVL